MTVREGEDERCLSVRSSSMVERYPGEDVWGHSMCFWSPNCWDLLELSTFVKRGNQRSPDGLQALKFYVYAFWCPRTSRAVRSETEMHDPELPGSTPQLMSLSSSLRVDTHG